MDNEISDEWAKAVNEEMAEGALRAIQELLDKGDIPRGTFADDQVRNLVAFYNRRGLEIDELRRAITGGPVKRFISPFPAPTPYETELLACMIEEVAEVVEETVLLTGSAVIKRATKTIRFGADEVQPGQEQSNKERLSTEVGDLLAILDFATAAGLIDPEIVTRQRVAKPKKLRKFLQNQPTEAQPYRLFLDDEREPPSDGGEWVIVRSYDEAVLLMQERGCPIYMSFDHDLGEGRNGLDVAKWMIDQDLVERDFMPDGFQFYVHSQNPVGAKNINTLLLSYMAHKKALVP